MRIQLLKTHVIPIFTMNLCLKTSAIWSATMSTEFFNALPACGPQVTFGTLYLLTIPAEYRPPATKIRQLKCLRARSYPGTRRCSELLLPLYSP